VTSISTQDIEALVEQFQRGDWREMHLRIGDVELFLSKDGNARLPERSGAPVPVAAPVAAAPAAVAAAPTTASPIHAPSATPAAGVGAVPPGWTQIKAPSLGTFYRAPKPGAPKFVEIGAAVTPDSDLCLIEVMKLFTTLRAGMSGTVREIYALDGELVEFDQPLFLIEPHA
jgi:acetyl-CoA carboxylase biotin carboxyl carrier protein